MNAAQDSIQQMLQIDAAYSFYHEHIYEVFLATKPLYLESGYGLSGIVADVQLSLGVQVRQPTIVEHSSEFPLVNPPPSSILKLANPN